MKTYSEKIADYITDLSFDDLPHEVVQKSKYLLMDTLGVMIFGSDAPSSLSVLSYFKDQGGVQETDVVYHGLRLPASSSAFVNGTMAHSFDYDDDLAACHIASCIIPSALAAAQKIKASGKELITSIVIGYDITFRLAETLDGHHLYAMGFHPTPVCGTFGAVAAVSKLLALSRDQIVDAMGIAGSFLSGTLEWLSDGSMTKRFHGGKSASEGIVASFLAQKGFTGPRSIFEGKNGIFKMFQAQKQYNTLVEDLSERFDILKSYIKLYPCCTCNAPIVDAILDIKKEARLNPDEITDVQVSIRKTCMSLVGEPLEQKQKPKTILDAQMSAPYCVAIALLEGELFPAQFTIDKVKNYKVYELAQKVKVVWDAKLEVDDSPRPVPACVTIKMSDGRVIKREVDYQKGTYRNPLTSKELEKKFSICVEGRLIEQNKKELIDMINKLEEIRDVNQIKTCNDKNPDE